MKVKRLFVLIIAIGLVCSLAACTGGNKTDSSGKSSGKSSASGQEGSNEKMTITLFDLKYGEIPPKNGKGIEMIKNSTSIISPSTYRMRILKKNWPHWSPQGTYRILSDLTIRAATSLSGPSKALFYRLTTILKIIPL